MTLSSVALRAYILERALAGIAEQFLHSDPGQQQVGFPIVVEVGDDAAERRPRFGQASLSGHVGKVTETVVAQQKVAHLPLLEYGPCQEQIGPAIAVVIQHDDGSAKAFPYQTAHHADSIIAEVRSLRPACGGGKSHLQRLAALEEGKRAGCAVWRANCRCSR